VPQAENFSLYMVNELIVVLPSLPCFWRVSPPGRHLHIIALRPHLSRAVETQYQDIPIKKNERALEHPIAGD
jgi:hypothetical protein